MTGLLEALNLPPMRSTMPPPPVQAEPAGLKARLDAQDESLRERHAKLAKAQAQLEAEIKQRRGEAKAKLQDSEIGAVARGRTGVKQKVAEGVAKGIAAFDAKNVSADERTVQAALGQLSRPKKKTLSAEYAVARDGDEDPAWTDLKAVIARAKVLDVKRKDLELASETKEGRLVDRAKEDLAQDIMEFGQECNTVADSWSQIEEHDRVERVLQLEYTAGELESGMRKYAGEIKKYDGKRAEKAAIIVRAMQSLRDQISEQEGSLKLDLAKVQQLERAIDDQRIWGLLQSGVAVVNAALSMYPPTARISSVISLLQKATDDSDPGLELTQSQAASMKLTGTITEGIGTFTRVISSYERVKKERDKLHELIVKHQQAIERVIASAQALNQSMSKWQSQLAKAQRFASKVTGVP